uniref:NCBP2 antisense 2 (head to head) n=1 Tax=Salmo trutta TaxID=8032 RepID=A0A673ZYG9_SALTR
MVLSRLLSALLNKAQVVEKLAELRPIRRAAQLTAYAWMKARIAGKDATTKLMKFKTVRQIRHEASGLPKNVGEVGRRAGRLRDSLVNDRKIQPGSGKSEGCSFSI